MKIVKYFSAILVFMINFSLLSVTSLLGDDKGMNNKGGLAGVPILEEIDFEKEMSQIKKFHQTQELLQKDCQLKQSDNDLDNLISLLENQRDSYLLVAYHFSHKNDSKLLVDVRQPIVSNWLVFYKSMADLVDKNFDFDQLPFLNIAPSGGPYPSGIAPKSIKEPEIRKDYEERLAKNARYAQEYRLQHNLKKLVSLSQNEINEFIIKSYSKSPRADGELVVLLDKYKYPEEEKAKIFRALNIPYKGFREWKTNDGLFTLTAKMISADKKEIKLEKSDGKPVTIEISALRKEDRDYVDTATSGAVFRQWTSADGRFTVSAKLVSCNDNSVTLEKEDGNQVTLSLDKLSEADKAFLKKFADTSRAPR